MNFKDFIETMAEAEKNFKAAIADFPEHSDFLSKSYLVVTRDSSQFSFKNSFSVTDIVERMVLVKQSDFKDNLSCLDKYLKEAQAAVKKAQGQEGKKLKEKIKKIEEELNGFPIEELEFHDDFSIFPIFPSVNIEIIQKLKGHPLVVQSQCMCKACVTVFFR